MGFRAFLGVRSRGAGGLHLGIHSTGAGGHRHHSQPGGFHIHCLVESPGSVNPGTRSSSTGVDSDACSNLSIPGVSKMQKRLKTRALAHLLLLQKATPRLTTSQNLSLPAPSLGPPHYTTLSGMLQGMSFAGQRARAQILALVLGACQSRQVPLPKCRSPCLGKR